MIKKLISLIFIILVGIATTSCSTKLHLGKYHTNFPTYGMFGTSIELKADGTFVKNFSGDMMNDNSYGTWITRQDTLILVFDTIKNPKSRYKGTESYLIKNKKLVHPFDKNVIKKLKGLSAWNSLPKHQKRRILKNINKSPKDFKGTMRKQYYISRD